MEWPGWWNIACLRNVKVVHRLPGRLRLSVPLATQIPPERQDVVDLVASLIKIPEAITAVNFNLTTGSLLIHYDPEQAGEREVVDFLRGILGLFIRHSAALAKLSPEQIVERKPQLEAIVRKAIRHRLVFDANIKVPENVLA